MIRPSWAPTPRYALDPAFSPSVTTYSATVEYQTSSTYVTATVEDASATISVNGDTITSGSASDSIALDVGSNSISITVTAEDGTTTKAYTVSVVREEASDDASLSSLALDGVSAEPAFSASVTEYTANVGFETKETNLVATAADEHAIISVNGVATASGAFSNLIALDEGSNTLTITVTAEDGVTTQSYTVTINRGSASDFAQKVCIKASDGSSWYGGVASRFGGSVALSGDGSTLAVAPVPVGTQTSFVYRAHIYSRDSAGAWSQQGHLETPGDVRNFATHRVAISDDGSTLAVARLGYGVRVYSRDSVGAWSQQAYLEAPNADTIGADHFGYFIALSRDGFTLAVGAPLEDSAASGVDGDEADNSAQDSGAAYVFTRDSMDTWSRQAFIKASNPGGKVSASGSGDRFGRAIALSSDGATLAVGAPGESSSATGINGEDWDNSAPGSGAVYVFSRDSANTWSQQAYVKSLSSSSYQGFGNAVALSSEGAVLAAAANDKAYVLARSIDGEWGHDASVTASNLDRADGFGSAVALSADGEVLAVGAPGEESASTEVNGDESDNSASDSGASYVFTRNSAGLWTQKAYIKAFNSNIGYCFCETGPEATGKNASRLVAYPLNTKASSPVAEPIQPSCPSSGYNLCYWYGMQLGHSIAMSANGTTLAVGAPDESSPGQGVGGCSTRSGSGSGASYVFELESPP